MAIRFLCYSYSINFNFNNTNIMDARDYLDKLLDPYNQFEYECPVCGRPQNFKSPCSSACEEAEMI
jgi:hypothetical protein